MKVAFQFFILMGLVLAACGKKKPDPAQEVRAFMADWERAVDVKSPAALDSLLTTAENTAPVDPQKFLAEIYNAEGITGVNLVGRELYIGQRQVVVTGRLVRSGIPDSLVTLSLTLLKTNEGWKLAAFRFTPFKPPRKDTVSMETSL